MNEMRKLMEVVIAGTEIDENELYHRDEVRHLLGLAYAEGFIKAKGSKNLSDSELEKIDNMGHQWAKNPTGYDFL